MINFVVQEGKQSPKHEKLKKYTIVGTTIVIALYVVAMAGMFGWRWYWIGKEKKVTKEHEDLLRVVASRANDEVVARKLDSRVRSAQTFLDNRGEAFQSADSLMFSGITVTGWEYEGGGRQTVNVKATDRETILSYISNLTGRYPQVQYNSIEWNKSDGWIAEIYLGGKPNASKN